jgi:glutathione S-transferase
LYYFAGRGLSDQIRWMLAATEISFTQRIIDKRAKFVKMAERQLPMGQLPLLQIDGLEIVQSQAIIRYIARRGNLTGQTSEDEVKCEMIVETVRDIVMLLVGCPFIRNKSAEEMEAHITIIKTKWLSLGSRIEQILKLNGGQHLVGSSLTYADVLTAHALTWVVEECGSDTVESMPALINLQNSVISLSGVKEFIRSSAFYPIGDAAYWYIIFLFIIIYLYYHYYHFFFLIVLKSVKF